MDEHYMRCQKAFAAALSMIVAHSEELFGQAKENYEKEGRGCLYIEFSSVEKMEAADFNGYVGGYLSQYKAKKRKYDVLDTSIVKYDPNNQFVLCLACADSSGRWIYKASALPRNAHEFVDKMAQKQQQQLQNQQEQVAKCAVCAKTTSDLKRCSRCQQVYYCGRECQVKDCMLFLQCWPIHKAACGPARPVQQQQ